MYLAGDAGAHHMLRGNTNAAASNQIPTAQWTVITGPGTANNTNLHDDIRHLTFDASGRLLACGDGGVFIQTSPRDSSGDWYTLAGDMVTAEFRSIALDPLSHAILGGTQDNGTPSEMQPRTGTAIPWTQIEFADGVAVAAVDAHTTDPTTGNPISYRYTSFQGSSDFELHIFDNTGTMLSSVNLCTSQLIDTNSGKPLNQVDNFDWIQAIGVNRQTGGEKRLLIAGHNEGVWESTDLGGHVTLISGSPINAQSFAYGHSTNLEALWVAAPSGVYARFAAGAVTQKTTFPGGSARAVAMSSASPNIAYVTTDHVVYQTTDGGTSWQSLTGDLSYLSLGPDHGPGVLYRTLYIPGSADGDRLVVTAAEQGVPGVFMMAVNNPGVWTQIGTNLPNANAYALDYDPVTDTLVVGTGGRGAWSVSGVTTLDLAPKAACKNVTASADATCHASASASWFNNGSVDPEGNPITVTAVDPVTLKPVSIGPDGLGTFPVTINVADNQGASALCNTTFTVIDTTPPVLQIPANKTVSSCADSLAVSIGQATATDNCATSLVPTAQVIAKNGVTLSPPIPVTNGQVTLGIGSYTVQWTVSDGSNPPVQANQTVTVGTAIEASQSFLIDDRGQLKTASGSYAAMFNSGTGATQVGQDGRTAGIVSRGPVTVQHRAVVSGNVVSGSTVSKDSDATITGTTTRKCYGPTSSTAESAVIPGANTRRLYSKQWNDG